MGTSLAGEGEKNCVRPISTSLLEGRKWLNFVVLHREIGIKRACVLRSEAPLAAKPYV